MSPAIESASFSYVLTDLVLNMKYLLCSDVILDFYIIKVSTCMSDSRCFLQPFAIDRAWDGLQFLTWTCTIVIDCMMCTTKDIFKRQRVWERDDKKIALKWLLERNLKLQTLHILISLTLKEDLTLLVSSTRVASSFCVKCSHGSTSWTWGKLIWRLWDLVFPASVACIWICSLF